MSRTVIMTTWISLQNPSRTRGCRTARRLAHEGHDKAMPKTLEDNPPGTLEEVAPEEPAENDEAPLDPKDPMPSDDAAETGIPTKDPSPDTTEPSS